MRRSPNELHRLARASLLRAFGAIASNRGASRPDTASAPGASPPDGAPRGPESESRDSRPGTGRHQPHEPFSGPFGGRWRRPDLRRRFRRASIDARPIGPIWCPIVDAAVVVTTVGSEEEANRLAREIVGRRHAACVNIVSGVRSIYRWKGQVCQDSEYLLIVKTLEGEFSDVAETIRELHSYELPEILSFSIRRGDPDFLQWIADGCDKTAAEDEELDDSEPAV